jgi:hypothetical protein
MKPNFQAVLIILLVITGPFGYAVNEILTLNAWYDLEPLILEEEEYPETPESIHRKLLEEARILFSAMIYGFSFTYTPSDNKRGVEELFILSLNAEIQWGDPNLKVISSEIRDNRLYCKIIYSLTDAQNLRRISWNSNVIPTAGGEGGADYFQGYVSKMESIKAAIREAIRNYVRLRVFNKPKEIAGEILLLEEPYTIIQSGQYVSSVKIKLLLKEIEAYTIF